jgi:dolichol kinase
LYQIALIPGSLLTGILLSPLLFLSRHIARRPVRRLRFPQEKQVHLRLLALGFYAGAALIIGGLIGMWTKWCLGGRDPWVYAMFYLLEGRKTWSRPVLLVYWALIGIISIAAWNRQLARSRRYRPRAIGNPETNTQHTTPSTPAETRPSVSSDPSAPPTPTIPSMISFPNLPNGVQVSLAATEFLDAADKRVPTLTLNARRKSFHGVAVLMFLPGIAFDVSIGPSVGDPMVNINFIFRLVGFISNANIKTRSRRSLTWHSALRLPYSFSRSMCDTLHCTRLGHQSMFL